MPPATNPIEHVQLLWTDFTNLTRCRAMLKEMFDKTNSTGWSLCYGIMSLPHSKDVTLENFVGEIKSVPDLATVVKAPWYSDLISNTYLCFSYLRKANLEPWDHCPRTFLKNQSDTLLQETGLAVQLGFEMEFYIYDTKDDISVPIDTTVAFETKSLQGKSWKVLTAIVEALNQLQIPVWSYHSESGHGQFEISIGPFNGQFMDTVRIGDSVVLARQTVYNIVASHGLQVTFVPRPFKDQYGSGGHLHISLINVNSTTPPIDTTTILEQFVAGNFVHLPELLSVFAPTVNSYERIKPGTWSGGYHFIGTENKEAPIRLVRNTKTEALERFEIKTPDNVSNPYLMIGSVIAAGLDGIRQKLTFPVEINVPPTFLPEDSRPKSLPSTLQEALQLFEESAFLKNLFGQDVHQLILALRKNEIQHWNDLPDWESRVKFLMSRY